MSKTTNKFLLQMLLNLMEEHRDIACGFHKKTKEEMGLFWQKAETELNSAGPPSKNITEWKKVWSDQKKYVRAKAAMNLKTRNGTGGGPNKEQRFSDIEQAIFNLIGMKEAVEGVAATPFGLDAVAHKRKAETDNKEPLAKIVVSSPIQVDFGTEVDVDPQTYKLVTPKNKLEWSNSYPKASARNSTASEVLEKELIIQKELCEAVKDVVGYMKENIMVQKELCTAVRVLVEDVQENHRKIYRSLDKIYDIKKQDLKLENEKFEETKRHNYVIESWRKREVEDNIEKNRRLLEIEELKSQMTG